jgi:general secretion pathway protein K
VTNPHRTRGFALIVVLWFLVLIAAIGAYMMANARTETAIARNLREAASAEALADAGVAQTVFNLTDTVRSNRWKLDGVPHRFRLLDGEVTVRVADEAAKINPNRASDALLSALFEAAGVERGRARRLGAAVADWIGPDMMPRPLGAKLAEYQAAGRSYGPPNAPLESLDELQLVLGMTPEIFAAVQPYLTIYTQRDAPDAKTAPLVIQRALVLATQQLRGAEKAAAPPSPALPATQAQDREAQSAPDTDVTAAQAQPGAPVVVRETIVAVEVIARGAAGGAFARHAVLKLGQGSPKGYAVMEWSRERAVN